MTFTFNTLKEELKDSAVALFGSWEKMHAREQDFKKAYDQIIWPKTFKTFI